MTTADLARMIRMRKLQQRLNYDINAIVYHLSNSGNPRPTADQWAGLFNDLDTAGTTLQQLRKHLAA